VWARVKSNFGFIPGKIRGRVFLNGINEGTGRVKGVGRVLVVGL
jgi:hypothetical protein